MSLVMEKTITPHTSFEITRNPPTDWGNFIDQSSFGTLYSSVWVDTVSRGYKAESLYACLRENGVIKTAAAGIIYDFFFFRMFFSNVPYGGILGDASGAETLINQLEAELKKKNVHQIRLTRNVERPYEIPDGYSEQKAFQHTLDLRGITAARYWIELRKNTRRDVQKAKKSGIIVRPMRHSGELTDYYRLYSLTMRRNSALCHYTKKLYEEIDTQLVKTGKACVLFADYQGKSIAAMLLVFSEDRTYLIGNVSDPAYLRVCPNDILYHAALELTLQKGLSYFDFMTSEFADENLMKYKEKWGAQRLPFVIYKKNLSTFRCRLWDAAWSFAVTFSGLFRANF